jgi:PKHD-type hydroxylase
MPQVQPAQFDDFSPFQNFIVWENAFTSAELDAIEIVGDGLALQKAGIQYEDTSRTSEDPLRSTRTAWMQQDARTNWIYERLGHIARAINDQVYRYDLNGFSDPLQYTVYDGGDGDHFGWHADQYNMEFPRKLSFSLQLSDGDDYQGCDLEIFNGSRDPVAISRRRGILVAFPGYAMHRVTPIVKGTRKALVFWACGPRFR